jgi:signal transduction histidine kinase
MAAMTTNGRLGRWRARHGAYAFGAGVIAVLVALFAFSLWYQHGKAIDQARRDVRNLAAILEQDIANKILLIDNGLVEVSRDVEVGLRNGSAADRFADADALRRLTLRLPAVAGIAVIGADGIVSEATTIPNTVRMDISDRDYFRYLRDAPAAGLHISAPFEARSAPGVWALTVSRAFLKPDGSFGGIVAASIHLAKLSTSFSRINVGETGTVVMWNNSGMLLTSYPPERDRIGRILRTGPKQCTPERPEAVFDNVGVQGIARILACRRLADVPLAVSVGLGRDEVLAEWRRGAVLFAVVLALCSGVILLFAHWVGRLHAAALSSAEARLRDAIESAGEGFALYDADDRLEMWNSKFLEQFPHFVELAPLAGRSFEELLRANVPHLAGAGHDPEAFIAKRMAQHRNPTGEPVVIQQTSGRWFMLYERRTSLGGTVSVRTDVTALKRNEERLELLADKLTAAKRQADEASQAKTKFLASMSHELRTPLNAIIGFAELIERQTPGPGDIERCVDYAHDIRRSGVHLLDLINDILDMSKIEAGRYQLLDEVIDLPEITDLSVRMLASRAASGGVGITIELPPFLPQLTADRRGVKQVLLNLLSNAVKFTPSGGQVVVRAVLEGNGGIAVMVEDNGSGIPEDQTARVFEPFRQVERLTRGKPEGTGLGLSICKGLMEAHGGSITLASVVGQGTTVTVRFPAERTVRRPLTVAVR